MPPLPRRTMMDRIVELRQLAEPPLVTIYLSGGQVMQDAMLVPTATPGLPQPETADIMLEHQGALYTINVADVIALGVPAQP